MVSEAVKLEREKRKTAREERLWSLVTDPTVRRLALLSGIVAFTAHVNSTPEKSGPITNALAVALPSVGIPLLAAECGVTDWKVLAALALAAGGVATVTNQEVLDAFSISVPGGGPPIISLLGPIPGLLWDKRKIEGLF